MFSSNTAGRLLTGLLFGGLGLGCSKLETVKTNVESVTSCNEFSTSDSFEDLKVQQTVRQYMNAGVSYRKLDANLRVSVRTACANIATDLAGVDTWSVLGETDDALSNTLGTGACDVAKARIAAVMDASAAANFAFVQVPGACHPDFAAQLACEAKCKSDATCDSGTVVTRCDPAQLSVQCATECSAQASCEGTAQTESNCMGKCESTCTGLCKGTCTGPDGKRTDNDPNCHGKCSSSCNGKCKGLCKMEVAANCGASVSCKGGCAGSYVEPKCESEFTPPTCTVDADCQASCTANVSANAICDPPHTELYANVSIAADVEKLKATLDTNLSGLVAANVQGVLVAQSAPKLVVTGDSILKAVSSLDAKSVSCATAVRKSAEKISASLTVTLSASASVVEACQSRSL